MADLALKAAQVLILIRSGRLVGQLGQPQVRVTPKCFQKVEHRLRGQLDLAGQQDAPYDLGQSLK